MGLTVRNVCKIMHQLKPNLAINVMAFINGDRNNPVPLYEYPDDDDFLGNQEASYVELRGDQFANWMSATVCLDLDKTNCKKEEKMKTVKAPVKLPSILELFEDSEQIEICIMLKTGKYVYLHGEAETLRGLDVIQGCFVDGIYTADPDTEEEGLYIRASKVMEEEKK